MIARVLRALDAIDRPPRATAAASALAVAVTGFAVVELHRMPSWSRPDALGDRLFHRTFGALHLAALALGALLASAAMARLRRGGWLDHLLLAGASSRDVAVAVALRAAALAAAYAALMSPAVGVTLFYRELPPALVASAVASTAACAALGALVGVSAASPRRTALVVLLLAAVGYRALGQSAADLVLPPLRAFAHGTLWWLSLLADGRAPTALRRASSLAPWWVVLAASPWLLDVAARRLVPGRPSWRVALASTAALTLPVAVALRAVTSPLDRLSCLQAALVAWTALVLAALEDELSLLVALGGVCLLGVAGFGGAPWSADSAVASAAVAACVVLVAATLRCALPRRGALVGGVVVVAWCLVPTVVRELLGPEASPSTAGTLAAVSPLSALELIARDARAPGAHGWRDAGRGALAGIYGFGAIFVTVAWLVARRLRGVVR